MLLIKRLKILLSSNLFYFVLIVFSLFHYCFNCFYRYNYETNVSEGTIIDYKNNDNNWSLIIKSGEYKYIAYYYDKNNQFNFNYGDFIRFKSEIRRINNNTIPKSFNYKKYLKTKNIYYSLNISQILKVKKSSNFFYIIKNKINNYISLIDKNGYMKSFIMGNKESIDDEEYKIFQNIGVAHLFAISGMHIGVLFFLSNKILFFIKEKKRLLFIDIILIFYMILIGSSPSIRRCVILIVLKSINSIFEFNLSLFKLFILTVLLILNFNIELINDSSFLYSIFTVGGILVSRSFILVKSKLLSWVKLSLVAFCFSLPVSLYFYYSINILSIIYNVIYIFYVSYVVYPLCLISFVLHYLYPLFDLSVNIMIKVSYLLDKIKLFSFYLDFNMVEVLVFYILLIIIFRCKKNYYFIGLIFLIVLDISIGYLNSNYNVYYFDVNQGDSSLIIMPHKKQSILIDTGGIVNSSKSYSNYIISFLNSKSISKIDTLVLTHGDFDHIGEAINLVNNFKVEKVILNCGPYNDLEKELIKVLDKKKIKYYSCIKELNIDKNKLYFLQTKEYDNENDNSNVIYTELGGYKFMFMGDASVATEKEIMNKYNLSNIDVLKVGHHGSRTSSGKDFINEINPKYSIISVGKNNRYGHPNKEVLENLEQSKIYRTDLDGSIEIKLNKNGSKIRTCPP